MIIDNIDYSLKDIPVCVGRNKKFRKSPKLYKGLIILFGISICDKEINIKNKIKIIKQLFNTFYKSPFLFNIDTFLKSDKGILEVGDMIYLNTIYNLAAVKKFFKNLDLKIIDYKKLKRRRYSMNFIFYINKNIVETKNSVLLDININQYGVIRVFMNINTFIYSKDIMQVIFFYNINKNFKFSTL